MNELRDRLAEALCKGAGDRQCVNYDPDVPGGCSWCERDADALLPLVRQYGNGRVVAALCEAADELAAEARLLSCGPGDKIRRTTLNVAAKNLRRKIRVGLACADEADQ